MIDDDSNNKMLTTSDNPYNPHDDYDAWMQWDQANGYFTAEYIARLSNPNVDYEDDEIAMQELLNDIINVNITGNYVLI